MTAAGAFFGLGVLTLAAELSIAVLPFEVLGLEQSDAAELRQVVVTQMETGQRARIVVPPLVVDQAVRSLGISPDQLASCLENPECTNNIMELSGADELLFGSAAQLGRTFILRLTILSSGQQTREVQDTVQGGIADLRISLREQVDQLLPATTRPWYRRWWVWTIVGTVLVGAGIGIALALTLPQDDPMPTYPLP